ncbi:MAG: OsmC family protein [Ignavibacteriales bacterium]
MPHEKMDIQVELINQKVKFKTSARENEAIIIDYIPLVGDGEGYMPLELLLISLASCSGSTVATLLRKMRKNITGFKVNAIGTRREEHPTGFKEIKLIFKVESNDIEISDVEKAIKMSEETFCPVWCMLKNNVEITWDISIIT